MPNKPKFPFRIITTWIHPSDISICEACKTPGPTYATENYIDMGMVVGTDMYVKLTNDHWVRAIKAQSREQFDATFTSHLCTSCLSEPHIASFGDTPAWQQALFLLTDKYGQVAIAHFILVNDYEDEGESFWFLCPVTDSILDVVDFVEEIEVESHTTKPTTREDIQRVIKDVAQFSQQHGKPIKIIHPDDHQ